MSQLQRIQLKQADCVRCGRCSMTCPMGIIAQSDACEYPQVVEDRAEACVACYHCVAICPMGAVSVDQVTAAACVPFRNDESPRLTQFAHLVRSRRSIRSYDPVRTVSRSQIEQLLDIVRWAPTARNTEQVKWILVIGHEKVRQLSNLVIDALADTPWGESLKKSRERGADPVLRGASAVACAYTDEDSGGWSTVDASIAVASLDLAATVMQLGTCWAGILMRAAQMQPSVAQWLGLVGEQKLYAALMMGVLGDERFSRIPCRNEPDVRWLE